MVLIMMFSFDSISRTRSSTCLLQFNDPILPLLCSTFEYYPLVSRGYRAIAPPLMNSCWSNTSHQFCRSRCSGLSSTEDTAYLLLHHSFCLMMLLFDCILLKPLDIKCRGHHQHFSLFQVSIEFTVSNTILAPLSGWLST